ncbi:MAG: hypothetical protein H6621_05820 [Halobacteriovoraceae bacterium]|nr:hypothetical protein [Halobacteriovoraceae bacterium]
MIRVKINSAPKDYYLGEQVFHTNEIIFGNDGNINILESDLKIAPVLVQIEDQSLSFKSQSDDSKKYDFHINGKLQHIPFHLVKGDKLSIEQFEIEIVDFLLEQIVTFKDKLNEEFNKIKNDPASLAFISELGDLAE